MGMTDWRGTSIKVGDIVVYPSRQGSHLWMTEGEVVEVTPRLAVRKKGGVRLSYPAPERVTVV